MSKGHLYFIMWVSWAWKGTLRENLDKLDIEDIYYLKSSVTRPVREGETPGYIYNFISFDEFSESIKNDEFLEYELVHNLHYYWTKKSDFYDWINSWKTMIKEIDMRGLIQLHEKKPEIKNDYTSIFLTLPEEKVRERILSRWELSEQEIQNRIDSTKMEVDNAKIYCDYIIDASKSPEDVLKEFLEIIGKWEYI